MTLVSINLVGQQENHDTTKTEPAYEKITFVDVLPSFPGGEEARVRYFSENLIYPQLAIDSNIQGVVYTSFTITADGSISNVTVSKGIGYGCDEEAVRVVAMMPKWSPASAAGKPLSVQFSLPIKFSLSKSGKQ